MGGTHYSMAVPVAKDAERDPRGRSRSEPVSGPRRTSRPSRPSGTPAPTARLATPLRPVRRPTRPARAGKAFPPPSRPCSRAHAARDRGGRDPARGAPPGHGTGGRGGGPRPMRDAPLSFSLACADRMIAAARAAGTRLETAENVGRRPEERPKRALIERGLLGTVGLLQCRFASGSYHGMNAVGAAWRAAARARPRGAGGHALRRPSGRRGRASAPRPAHRRRHGRRTAGRGTPLAAPGGVRRGLRRLPRRAGTGRPGRGAGDPRVRRGRRRRDGPARGPPVGPRPREEYGRRFGFSPEEAAAHLEGTAFPPSYPLTR